jgi:serine/threonine-protein kinase
MAVQTIDGVSFAMKEAHDFSFLSKFGRVFAVFDQNDSGNISFGVDSGAEKYFIKVAGAETAESATSAEKAVEVLKAAVPIYRDLGHPRLIRLVEHFAHGGLYATVFMWADGDCLFDHWNFEKYAANPGLTPPRDRFRMLSCEKRLGAFDAMFDFLIYTESKNYVAVDFGDGNIMYDFERDAVTICDIDFFRKRPAVNDIGERFWGTPRLKSPEEYTLGAAIDSATNVFTLGALLFHFFGDYNHGEVRKLYRENAFYPCRQETWALSEALYGTALKAVCPDRAGRYGSVAAFYRAWIANK